MNYGDDNIDYSVLEISFLRSAFRAPQLLLLSAHKAKALEGCGDGELEKSFTPAPATREKVFFRFLMQKHFLPSWLLPLLPTRARGKENNQERLAKPKMNC
jgi:hypothetical protein